MSFTKVEVSGLNQESGSLGFRNRIINGAMEISQRGTSFAAISGGTYTLDRFIFGTGGTTSGGVATITQSTDVPNNTFQNSLRVDVTTADTSIAAGDFSHIIQFIEGYNIRDLIGQTFTLSFWIKSPKTGVHCVAFRNGNTDRSYVMEYTVSAANTWEYKTITVNGGLITAGTWNWTNGRGLDIVFTLLTGTTFQTTPGSWQVGNFIGTSNQVNCMDNVNNDFFLTGVQLELGPVATPFERRPYGLEFSLCQRYYQTNVCSDGAMNNANTLFVTPVGFANSPMRTTPNVSLRSGTNAIHRPGIAFYNITAITETSTAAYLSLTISNNYGANLPGQLMPNAIDYSAEL